MGCCASLYLWVGCVSKSGLMGVVEKVRIGDRHPSVVLGLTWGLRYLVLLWVSVICLYYAKVSEPMSHSVMVDSNFYVG